MSHYNAPVFNRRQMMMAAGLGMAPIFLGHTVIAQQTSHETKDLVLSKKPHQWRFALNTGTLLGLNLSIEEEIDVTSKAGYDGIEIWLMRLEKYLSEGKTLADLKKRLDDTGLVVENAIGFAPWIVDDDAIRSRGIEQMKRDMGRLAEIGCHRIAAPASGATSKHIDDLEACGERYRTILEIGDEFGVTPLLEIWGSSATLSRLSEAAAIVVAAAHPKASLLLDTYHLYRGGNKWDSLRQLNGATMPVFHLNDYPAEPFREKLADKDRVYPGDGVCPLDQLLSILNEIGFDGTLSLELFNQTYWETQSALEIAKTGLEKMKAIIT